MNHKAEKQGTDLTLILGIETSGNTAGCAVGLMENNATPEAKVRILSAHQREEPQKHCENLPLLINAALEEAGTNFNELDLIVVDVGPGLYTGLRVGITTAMFLAYGLQLPTLGFCSVDLLAFQFHNSSKLNSQNQSQAKMNDKLDDKAGKKAGNEPDAENALNVEWVISIVDAKRGEVFYAGYRLADLATGNFSPAIETGVAKPQELIATLETKLKDFPLVSTTPSSPPTVFPSSLRTEGGYVISCVGDVELLATDDFASAGYSFHPDLDPNLPEAKTLIHLAAANSPSSYVSPHQLKPIYIRMPDISSL